MTYAWTDMAIPAGSGPVTTPTAFQALAVAG